ncbi:MAG: hypothetical protein AAF458_22555 [Pseudomonadota bacterium]
MTRLRNQLPRNPIRQGALSLDISHCRAARRTDNLKPPAGPLQLTHHVER